MYYQVFLHTNCIVGCLTDLHGWGWIKCRTSSAAVRCCSSCLHSHLDLVQILQEEELRQTLASRLNVNLTFQPIPHAV